MDLVRFIFVLLLVTLIASCVAPQNGWKNHLKISVHKSSPFLEFNHKMNMFDGIEYKLLQTIAGKLNFSMEFKLVSHRKEIQLNEERR